MERDQVLEDILSECVEQVHVENGDFVFVGTGVEGGRKHYVAQIRSWNDKTVVVSFMREAFLSTSVNMSCH